MYLPYEKHFNTCGVRVSSHLTGVSVWIAICVEEIAVLD